MNPYAPLPLSRPGPRPTPERIAAFAPTGWPPRLVGALIADGHKSPRSVLRLSQRGLSVIPNVGPRYRELIEEYRRRIGAPPAPPR